MLNQKIYEWFLAESQPNVSRGYYQCPVCKGTWQGQQSHEIICWVPMLLAETIKEDGQAELTDSVVDNEQVPPVEEAVAVATDENEGEDAKPAKAKAKGR